MAREKDSRKGKKRIDPDAWRKRLFNGQAEVYTNSGGKMKKGKNSVLAPEKENQ